MSAECVEEGLDIGFVAWVALSSYRRSRGLVPQRDVNVLGGAFSTPHTFGMSQIFSISNFQYGFSTIRLFPYCMSNALNPAFSIAVKSLG